MRAATVSLLVALLGCGASGSGSAADGTDGGTGAGTAWGSTGEPVASTGGGSTTTGGTGGGSTTDATTGSSSGAGSTGGTACDPGEHGCECFEGDCLGDLVCGQGDVCFEPGECQGVEGTEGCECGAGDTCFDDLQCWAGKCYAQCGQPDPDSSDMHCGGTCGNACPKSLGIGGCSEGECLPVWSECVDATQVTQDCSDVCGSSSKTCSADGCDGSMFIAYGSEQDCTANNGGSTSNGGTCATGLPAQWARCCCG